MIHNSYLSRKSRLLQDFDRLMARVKYILESRLGKDKANSLIRESRQEYEALIPQIPYIGDNSPFLIFLFPAIRHLAVYRTLHRQGGSVEDAGRLIYEMSEAELKAMPRWIQRLIGYIWFSKWFSGRLQKRAMESQARKYPGDYVLVYVDGDGNDFDYGIDYLECASCKFLKAQGAIELAPYVCALDKVVSEMLGWGLHRTMTLAEGYAKCDFRFKKGGQTQVVLPQSLQSID